MQAQCAKVKEKIQKQIHSVKPAYVLPLFIEYLCKDLAASKNPILEGSKILNEINRDLEKRWQEFRKSSPIYQREKIKELLQRNYLVYSRTDHYREYLYESLQASRNPFERFQKIEEELEKGERKPPFEWRMSLEKKMDPNLLERLDRVRNDKFFQEYVHLKTQWLKRIKDKKPEGTDQENRDLEAHKGYVETLPKLHEWIMDQRYFNFTKEKAEPCFSFLEIDFNEIKRRKLEQQRQMQSQGHIAPAMPQYSHQQMLNQHQNQHAYQHPQQRTQMNIQPNQQQILHQQQRHQYANHSQSPQYTQQDQNHQHYLNNRSHYIDPHAGPQINNNSLNQPSSYRSPYPAAVNNNQTEAMNNHINNQYNKTYDERDNHRSHTSAQHYSTNSQETHNSHQRPQQSSYFQQANTHQQSGHNQQIRHNEQPFEYPPFDSMFNQQHQTNSNFYSGSMTHNDSTSHSQTQNHLQAQFDNRNQFEEFFIPQDFAETYVADGKRDREDYGDFDNINFNQEFYGDFVERKKENYQDFTQTSKKVKTNPSPQQELNIAQAKSNTIPSTFTPSTMEDGSPQTKQNGIDLSQVRKDSRFHILGEQAYPGYLDIIINRNDSGTMSAYEKIGLRIFQDGSKKIEIIDMANYGEFEKEFGEYLFTSLHTGQLENVLDLWIKFLDKYAVRADTKLQEWDAIF